MKIPSLGGRENRARTDGENGEPMRCVVITERHIASSFIARLPLHCAMKEGKRRPYPCNMELQAIGAHGNQGD